MARSTIDKNLCPLRQDYLSRRLDPHAHASLETHLGECTACREEVAFWQQMNPSLDHWKNGFSAEEVTQGDIYKLISDVSPRKTAGRKALKPILAFGSSGILALAIVWALSTNQQTLGTQQSTSDTTGRSTAPATLAQQTPPPPLKVFETGPEERLNKKINDDTLGLESSTRVALVASSKKHTRFRVEKGTAAFQVDKRADGQSFVVSVTKYQVRVVGTQFSVSKDQDGGVAVVVNEGLVDVEGPKGPWRLGAGDRLYISPKSQGAKLDAPPEDLVQVEELIGIAKQIPSQKVVKRRSHRVLEPEVDKATGDTQVAVPSLQSTRQLLASGDTASALAVAKAMVENNPGDGAAWMLLGDCHRKLTQWDDSVLAYQKSIEHSRGSGKSRAMYQAATIYQQKLGDHKQAASMFESYLQNKSAPSSLRDVAKLNLAKSLIETGQPQKASGLLKEVVASQKDSYLAKNAKQLLEKMH